jgi:hypothetical protein
MATSIAETLRSKAAEVRTTQNTKSSSPEKKKEDINAFFEYMKNDAVAKMQYRADKGYNSANILEYTYAEYFFIGENGEIVRTPKYSKPTTEGGKAYRIFEAIRTNEFKELLDAYQAELGDGLEIAMWWPGGNINVIEAIWGPTKYHRKTNTRQSTITSTTDETAAATEIPSETPTKNPKSYANIARTKKPTPISTDAIVPTITTDEN